jgi:hypothetical protein
MIPKGAGEEVWDATIGLIVNRTPFPETVVAAVRD